MAMSPQVYGHMIEHGFRQRRRKDGSDRGVIARLPYAVCDLEGRMVLVGLQNSVEAFPFAI